MDEVKKEENTVEEAKPAKKKRFPWIRVLIGIVLLLKIRRAEGGDHGGRSLFQIAVAV